MSITYPEGTVQAVVLVDDNRTTYPLSGAAGNSEVALIASGARTATAASSDQSNPGGNRLTVFLDVTVVAVGTGGLQLSIEGKDPVSGKYFYLNALPSAITEVGQYVYELGPGVTSTGGSVLQATSGQLPKTWRIEVVHGDATSYTYSVSASVGA